MERAVFEKHLDKPIKLRTRQDRVYTGKIISLKESYFEFLDKNSVVVFFDYNAISLIEVR